MNAETIARELGAVKAGSSWIAHCPAHDDRSPSLAIRDADGKVLVHCHAGCKQAAVIAALRDRGLWSRSDSHAASWKEHRRPGKREPDRDDAGRRETALAIWRATKPARATLVETYLAARGIHLPLPRTLRFHPALRHATGGCWPAMVGLVTTKVDRDFVAIHRTWLKHDGSDKAPLGERQKMMLGPRRGGAVHLAKPRDCLMVGEGIETCLSVMQATGDPAWAALSATGLCSLELPPDVRNVIILADGDDAGERAVRDATLRWKSEGRRVRIARPPRGLDFNDMLTGRTPEKSAR
jgi:hypothetical protein